MSDTSSTSSETGASLQVSVIFNGRVQADIDSVLARQSSAETSGVLVGTADPTLGLVVVLGSEPLPPTNSSARSVEFTPALWEHMIDVVIERHPGQRIVGWYHGHLGSGVFLSGHDLLIHTTFFSQPWQVAYVVDPTRDERGIFAWRGQDVVRVEHWDVTSGAKGVATSVAPNEPEGRTAVLRHLAQPVNPRTGSTVAVPSIGGVEAPRLPADEQAEWPEQSKQPEPGVGTHEAVDPALESFDALAPGHPHDEQADDDIDALDRPTAPIEANDDLDAWIATLPSGEAVVVANPPTRRPPGDASPLDHQQVSDDSITASMRPPRRTMSIVAVVAVLVAAIVIVLVLTSGSDDKGSSATTTAEPVTVSAVTTPPPTVASKPATTIATTTTERSEETVATDPPTSSTAAPTTVAPTVATVATPPPTPDAVTSPVARIGTGSIACVLGSDGLFIPVANCFVPLPNGNIVADFNDSLICADPPGTTLADASPFLVGFGGDPLAVIADAVALPRCDDLSYAKNVMAAGAETFAGLCGNNSTTINQNATRCFAQNPSTGAIAALVTAVGTSDGLAGLCFTAGGQQVPVSLTWTTPGVDASWRIASVAYEPGIQQFVATVNQNGNLATTIIACA